MSRLSDKVYNSMVKTFLKYGQVFIIKQKVPGEYDPNTLSVSGDSVTATAVRGIAENLRSGNNERADAVVVDDVIHNRRKVTIAARGWTRAPAPGDTLEGLDNAVWTIFGTNNIAIQGEVVGYVLLVKS